MKLYTRLIFVTIFLILFSSLFSDVLNSRFIATCAAYYPQYPDYDYDRPILGLNFNAEVYNLMENFGIGGSTFLQIKSYDQYFQSRKTYDIYVHNFFNYRHEKSYFMYGFFGGIRRTDLEYENYKTSENLELTMNRPLLGFHFSSHAWGFTISWTQAENRKPTLIYEIKFRNPSGIIFQIGRSNRGPVSGVKSDFHFYMGYEVFR